MRDTGTIRVDMVLRRRAVVMMLGMVVVVVIGSAAHVVGWRMCVVHGRWRQEWCCAGARGHPRSRAWHHFGSERAKPGG